MAGEVIPITIPKWGLTMTEGTLTKWHVSLGDEVAVGQLLADIETSKIVNELEAREAGTIRKIVCEEGQNLPVGALIAVMAPAEVDDSQIEAFIGGFSVEDAEPEEEPATARDDAPTPGVSSSASADVPRDTDAAGQPTVTIPDDYIAGPHVDNNAVHATAQARKLANKFELDLSKFEGSGRRGRISKADVQSVLGLDRESFASVGKVTKEPPATPLARRLAEQLNVDLTLLSVPDGQTRLRSTDIVVAARSSAPGTRPATGAVMAPAIARPVALSARADETYEDVPLSGIRTVIAERLSASKATAPHYRVAMKARMDALLRLRREIGESAPEQRISINDMLIKAAATALASSPDINIQFDGLTIRRFKDAHISVAVALDDGLITPVVRHANRKGLLEISREMANLSERAQRGQLSPSDYEGGSFSISNLGMFGVSHFDAIINPPQAAILAIGGIERVLEPATDSDAEQVSSIMTMTLSSDHRVIDGAVAARFLSRLRGIIERPLAMLA